MLKYARNTLYVRIFTFLINHHSIVLSSNTMQSNKENAYTLDVGNKASGSASKGKITLPDIPTVSSLPPPVITKSSIEYRKQWIIKLGILRRAMKDLMMYGNEIKELEEKMKMKDEDTLDKMNQLEKVKEESEGMIKYSREKVEEAREDLVDFLEDEEGKSRKGYKVIFNELDEITKTLLDISL